MKHKRNGALRAMKTIKISTVEKLSKESRENFLEMDELFAELAILKEIDHPNVMRIYELFHDEVNYYLIMELMHGGELFDRIKLKRSFTEKEAAEYMK